VEITFKGHEGPIIALVDMDLKRFSSSSRDHTVRIWEKKTGWCLRKLEGHIRSVTKMIYVEKENVMITCSLDKTLKLWYCEDGRCLQSLTNDSKIKHMVYLGKYDYGQAEKKKVKEKARAAKFD
jgi:WD40 repeat protein